MIRQLIDTPLLLWWTAAAVLAQGLAILAAFLIARRYLASAAADVRYRLTLGTLLLVALSLPVTLFIADQALGVRLAGLAAAAAPSWPVSALTDRLRPPLPWLVIIWSAGALAILVHLAAGAWRLHRLIRAARPAPPHLCPSAEALAAAGLRVAPAVRESAIIPGPFVAGWGRGVLMIPAGLATRLTPREREAVLLHELVHLRRRDFAVNLLQRVVQAAYWFHPAAWLLGAELDRIREECCDEAVVRAVGRASDLARALVHLEEIRVGSGVLAMAGSGGHLSNRIQRLLAGVAPRQAQSAPAWCVMGLLAVASIQAAHAGGAWAAAVTSRSVPVVTIAAEDPAGHFTLEMAGGVVRGLRLEGVAVPRQRLLQSGRTVRLVDERGATTLDIEIQSPGAIRWSPRAPPSP